MLAIVVDGLVGLPELGVLAEGVAGVGVAVVVGEVAAGDLHPDPVALLEEVAGRPEVDLEPVDLSRLRRVGLSQESRYLALRMPSAAFMA